MAAAPALSVVVACLSAPEVLARCAAALRLHVGVRSAEVLFIGRWENAAPTFTDVQRLYPEFSWIGAPDAATVPELRALGAARSRGQTIALIEDDCVVQAGWFEALSRPITPPVGAVGGAIEPGDYATGLDWAVYLCEYGRFGLPLEPGEGTYLPGNNVAYARDVLNRFLSSSPAASLNETAAHEWLRSSGYTLLRNPEMLVRNVNRWGFANIAKVPYHHGRSYAARQAAGRGFMVGASRAALTLALPLVFASRVAGRAAEKGRLRTFFTALPFITLFVLSWSAGEAMGNLWGPGKSESKWR